MSYEVFCQIKLNLMDSFEADEISTRKTFNPTRTHVAWVTLDEKAIADGTENVNRGLI